MANLIFPPIGSVAEACFHLGIKRTLFYRLVADGALKVVKIGRRTVVQREELDRFLAENTVERGVGR